MALHHNSSDAGNSDMPKRSYRVLPLSKKKKNGSSYVKESKKNIYMLGLLGSRKWFFCPWNCEEGKKIF